MTNRYSPLPPPGGQEYAYRELLDLTRALNEDQNFLGLQTLNTAPDKPREGMVVKADGTNWDPGAGAGYYGYRAGAWRALEGGGGSGANLTYTAATRVVASDTGTDATLPLVTTGDAGLAPASGGGTTNFLRADATWAAPTASVADGDKGDITVSSSGTVWTIDNGVISETKLSTHLQVTTSIGFIYATAANYLFP